MKSTFSKSFGFVTIMLVVFFVFIFYLFRNNNIQELANTRLAIRQTVHEMNQILGDSTQNIQPVHIDNAVYRIQFPDGMVYDSFPNTLHQNLIAYGIHKPYQVDIFECEEDLLMLGFNTTSVEQSEIPCLGREQTGYCMNVVITFYESPIIPKWLILVGLFGLFLFSYFYYQKTKKSAKQEDAEALITFGESTLNENNYQLINSGGQQTLTYREYKLLSYMIRHQNEVLSRDTIMENVWGDDGVIVGRSLDVFISKLRKILQDDGQVQIKTIRGIGYKLEVES